MARGIDQRAVADLDHLAVQIGPDQGREVSLPVPGMGEDIQFLARIVVGRIRAWRGVQRSTLAGSTMKRRAWTAGTMVATVRRLSS